MILIVLVLFGAFGVFHTWSTFAAAPNIKIYLSPKIDQPGVTPGSSGDAASVGSAQLSPADTSRTMNVQKRLAGTTEPWKTIVSAKPDKSGFVYFKGWATDEYRAVAAKTDRAPAIVSQLKRYEWQTTFSDEFSGTTLSEDKWKVRGATEVEGMTRAHGDTRACDSTGEILKVKAIVDPDNPSKYLNCHVGTQSTYNFTGGWAAARVKFHKYPGSHSAFWLQAKTGYKPNNAEVDVAEYFGSADPGAATGTPLQQNVYYDWTDDGVSNIKCECYKVNDIAEFGAGSGYKWWNSYHVYSVRWIPGEGYMLYIDDHKVRKITAGISSNPEFLVLSMLTRDYEVGKMRNDKISSYSMDVDWVRVWQ